MKKTLPMLPLRGKYIFPNTVIHFDVSRSRSVKAIEEAMEHDQMIFLNNQIDPTAEDPGIEDLYRVKQVVKLPKNILRVFAEGLFRAELSETVEYEPFYKVEVLYDHVEQQSFEEFEREAFLRMIKEAFEGYAKAWPHIIDRCGDSGGRTCNTYSIFLSRETETFGRNGSKRAL